MTDPLRWKVVPLVLELMVIGVVITGRALPPSVTLSGAEKTYVQPVGTLIVSAVGVRLALLTAAISAAGSPPLHGTV